MTIETIIDLLEENKDRIIEMLISGNWRFFRDYFFIKEHFDAGNLDDEFKQTFCRFYVLNGPMGLNGRQKEKFFELLSLREFDLEKIIKELHQISGYSGSRKIFLSFATKLIHTVDNSSPIYDRNVAFILKLAPQVYDVSLEERINNRMDIYQELKNKFIVLLANEQVKIYLKNIRQKLRSKAERDGFNWQDELISDSKLLDSSLWALYSIIR